MCFQSIHFSKTKNPVLSILITRNIVLSNRRIWFSNFSFICIMDSDGKIKSVIEGKKIMNLFSEMKCLTMWLWQYCIHTHIKLVQIQRREKNHKKNHATDRLLKTLFYYRFSFRLKPKPSTPNLSLYSTINIFLRNLLGKMHTFCM